MNRIFNHIVKLTPRQLLLRLWGLLFITWPLATIPRILGLAFCVGLVVIVGYSYTVILGMPGSGKNANILGKVLLTLLSACVVTVAIAFLLLPIDGKGNLVTPASMNGWASVAFAAMLDTSVFLPFFVATHVIDVARQIKGSYKPLDFIPTFLGLYFGLFGGFIYTHRLVREVTERSRPTNAS